MSATRPTPDNGRPARRNAQAPGGRIGATGWASAPASRGPHPENSATNSINREHRPPALMYSSRDMGNSLRVMYRDKGRIHGIRDHQATGRDTNYHRQGAAPAGRHPERRRNPHAAAAAERD